MSARYWVVMPAAGSGRRMGAAAAKQYLPLLNRTVIEWALTPLLDDARIAAIVVVLAADDAHWQTLTVASHAKIRTAIGGIERADSVRAGVTSLAREAHPDDWVLVHDAARPCLHELDLDKLITQLDSSQDEVGGLLATPLADTLKHADATAHVVSTVPRSDLWRALTPQMFRYQVLQRALQTAGDSGARVTDEASAVEALGLQPKLISGRTDNIKITVPDDLALAASILTSRIQKTT